MMSCWSCWRPSCTSANDQESEPVVQNPCMKHDDGEDDLLRHLGALRKFNLANEHFSTFTKRFEHARLLKPDVSLKPKLLKSVFASLLDEHEKCVHDLLSEELRTNSEWTEYLNALFDLFHSEESITLCKEEFAQLTQQDSESVTSFMSRVQRASIYAYPFDVDDEEREKACCNRFLQGLQTPNGDKILKANNPTTFLNAYEHAKRYEYVNQRSNVIKSSYGLPSSLSLLTVVIACLSLFATRVDSLANYTLCERNASGVYILPAKQVYCPDFHVPSPSISLQAQLHIRNFTQPKVDAWKCTIETHFVGSDCWAWVPFENETRVGRKPANERECRLARRENMFKNYPLIAISPTVSSSKPEDFFKGSKSCGFMGDAEEFVEVMIIERSTVGVFEGGVVMSPLMINDVGCNENMKSCLSRFSTVVWDEELKKEACNFIPLDPIDAILRNHTIVFERNQSALHISSLDEYVGISKECFQFPVYQTSDGSFVSFPGFPQIKNIADHRSFYSNSTHSRNRRSPQSRWKLPPNYETISQWTSKQIGRALKEFDISFNHVHWYYEEFSIQPLRAIHKAICGGALMKQIKLFYNSFSFEGLEIEFMVEYEINRTILEDHWKGEPMNLTERRLEYESGLVMHQTDGSPHPERVLYPLVDQQFPNMSDVRRNSNENSLQSDLLEFLYNFALAEFESKQHPTAKRFVRAAEGDAFEDQPLSEALLTSVGSTADIGYMKANHDARDASRRKNMQNSANARSNYLMHEVREVLEKDFRTVTRAICHAQEQQLNIIKGFLNHDVNTGVRLILNRLDVIGRFVGEEMLLVQECVKIEIDEVSDSKKIGEECFEFIPSYTYPDRQLVFLVPGTNEISRTSKTESCEFQHPTVKRVNETHFTVANQTITVPIMEGYKLKTGENLNIDFHASGLYDKAIVSSFNSEMAESFGGALRANQRNINSLFAVINNPSSAPSDNHLLDYKKIADSQQFVKKAFFVLVMAYIYYIIAATALLIFIIALSIYFKCACCVCCFPMAALVMKIDAFDPAFPQSLPTTSHVFRKKKLPTESIPASSHVFRKIMLPTESIPTSSHVFRKKALPSAPPVEEASINAIGYTSLVKAKIGGFKTHSLMDPGANTSVIGLSLARKAGLKITQTALAAPRAANHSRIKLVGETITNVTLGSTTIKHHVIYVTDDNAHPAGLILGTDFAVLCRENGIRYTFCADQYSIMIGKDRLMFVGYEHCPITRHSLD